MWMFHILYWFRQLLGILKIPKQSKQINVSTSTCDKLQNSWYYCESCDEEYFHPEMFSLVELCECVLEEKCGPPLNWSNYRRIFTDSRLLPKYKRVITLSSFETIADRVARQSRSRYDHGIYCIPTKNIIHFLTEKWAMSTATILLDIKYNHKDNISYDILMF